MECSAIQSALSLPFAGHPTNGTSEIKYKFCRVFFFGKKCS